MTQTIKLCLIDDDGNKLELPEKGVSKNIGSKIDLAICDIYTEIIVRINNLGDDEMRIAEKFNLALNLENYLSDLRRIYKMEEVTNAD